MVSPQISQRKLHFSFSVQIRLFFFLGERRVKSQICTHFAGVNTCQFQSKSCAGPDPKLNCRSKLHYSLTHIQEDRSAGPRETNRTEQPVVSSFVLDHLPLLGSLQAEFPEITDRSDRRVLKLVFRSQSQTFSLHQPIPETIHRDDW